MMNADLLPRPANDVFARVAEHEEHIESGWRARLTDLKPAGFGGAGTENPECRASGLRDGQREPLDGHDQGEDGFRISEVLAGLAVRGAHVFALQGADAVQGCPAGLHRDGDIEDPAYRATGLADGPCFADSAEPHQQYRERRDAR
jgi:hypothetical protein